MGWISELVRSLVVFWGWEWLLEAIMVILQLRKKKPVVAFSESAENRAGEDTGPRLTWLHLRVDLRKPLPWEFPIIERCSIHMAMNYPNGKSTKHDLRWQSRAPIVGGEHEITLEHGHPRLIPIASRNDEEDSVVDNLQKKLQGGNGEIKLTDQEARVLNTLRFHGHRVVRITDDNVLLHGVTNPTDLAEPGEYICQLELKSGRFSWISDEYILRVPTRESTAHFDFRRKLK